MIVMLDIFLLILNLCLGFNNIANDRSPYVIALNFFAAGFIAMAAIVAAT